MTPISLGTGIAPGDPAVDSVTAAGTGHGEASAAEQRQHGRMIGHLGINVPDLTAAQRYYDRLMPLVGFEPFLAADDEFAYRPRDGKPGTYLFFYPAQESGGFSRHRTGLQHLAFMVKTRSAVDAVHAHVLADGNRILHPPQRFPQYAPPYYATFWLDPFGLMLEAVCHHDRP